VRLNRLFIITAVLLVIGIATIMWDFHGSAGFNLGSPLSVTSMNLSISATGGRVLVGLVGVILGAILFAITLIAAIVKEFGGARPAR
jgi:hypothetical protein